MKNVSAENMGASVIGAVLAGGRSSRMGRDKLGLAIQGRPMLCRVLEVMGEVFPEIVVVGDPEKDVVLTTGAGKVPPVIVADRIPDVGPIGGLYTALDWVLRSKKYSTGKMLSQLYFGLFVVAGDMPFLKREVIQAIVSKAPDYDVVIPRIVGRRHPLHAFYALSCLGPLEAKIKRGDLTLHTLWPEARVYELEDSDYRTLDPSFVSLTNINTPEELEFWEDRELH